LSATLLLQYALEARAAELDFVARDPHLRAIGLAFPVVKAQLALARILLAFAGLGQVDAV
jgi:hypothetical protein